MESYQHNARTHAIGRGLAFIYELARDPAHFAPYGSDLLNCFLFIATRSRDVPLRRTARRMGRERAAQWRRNWPTLPRAAAANTILDYLYGSRAADLLGLRAPALKAQLKQAARRFDAPAYLAFDPRCEPPPADVPDSCAGCGAESARARTRCRRCRRALTPLSRYKVWYDALNCTYNAARYGVTLGARYADVLRWLPTLRPYPDPASPDHYDAVYAVTHLVYTLNDFSRYRLNPRWLPREYEFLRAQVRPAIAQADAEMVGELLDSLKAFGLTARAPLLRVGYEYLLAQQNADGSWGDPTTDDVYARYHPTWTVIDGLRDYAWRGTRLCFPKVMPLLAARAGPL